MPVHAGDPAGEVSYYYKDRLLFTLPLIFQYGLEPDPTASPAPVLTVETRPLPSSGETAAPVQEIPAEPQLSAPDKQTNLFWFVLPPLILIGGVFVFLLVRRKKA